MYTKKEIGERIAKLRIEKGDSARCVSQVLGKNESYINNIENGKSYPSMLEFFNICEYFGVKESDFFDMQTENPKKLADLTEELKGLTDEQIELLRGFVKQMK